MEILNIVGSVASIVSLLVSLFVAGKVVKIINKINSIKIDGEGNFIAGRDVSYRSK